MFLDPPFDEVIVFLFVVETDVAMTPFMEEVEFLVFGCAGLIEALALLGG